MLMVRLIPNCFPNSQNALEANWGPWSNIALSGSPKRLYMLLRRCSAVPLVVIVVKTSSILARIPTVFTRFIRFCLSAKAKRF